MTVTATAWTYRRKDRLRNHKVVFMAMPLVNTDTNAEFATGLKKIYSYSISAPGQSAKYATGGTVTGGTINIALTTYTTNGTLYLTAYGI